MRERFRRRTPSIISEAILWSVNRKDSEATSDNNHLGHAFRGISVHHFSQDFLSRVEMASLTRDASIYVLEPKVIRPASADFQCPRDKERGAAYVDTVSHRDHAGLSNFMLSYSWGYSIGNIVDGLVAFCDGSNTRRNHKQTYVWICCLFINQHRVQAMRRVGNTIPFKVFEQAFGERVEGIGHVLVLMLPWKDPEYLTRVWCVFEMHHALNSAKVDLTVVMPPLERHGFRAALLSVNGIEYIFRTFAGVRIENAKASIEEDRCRILKMVEDGVGVQKLNDQISRYLQLWAVEACESELENCRQEADPEQIAQLCTKIGTLMALLGLHKREAVLLGEAQRLRELHGNLETPDGVELLRKIGQRLCLYEDFEAASDALAHARQICEQMGTLRSTSGSNVLVALGKLKCAQGDYFNAMAVYHEAQQIAREVGPSHFKDEATLLLAIGEALLEAQDIDEAENCLIRGQAIYSMVGMLEGPAGAGLLCLTGKLKRRRGAPAEAVEALREGIRIHQRVGTLDTPQGASLLVALGDAQVDLGDASSAKEAYGHAWTIYGRLGFSEQSPSVRLLMTKLRLPAA